MGERSTAKNVGDSVARDHYLREPGFEHMDHVDRQRRYKPPKGQSSERRPVTSAMPVLSGHAATLCNKTVGQVLVARP